MLQEGGNAVTDELHSSAVKRSMKKEKNEKEEKKDNKNEIQKSEKERRDSKEHSSKHRKSYESEKEKSATSQTLQIDSSSGNNIPNKNFAFEYCIFYFLPVYILELLLRPDEI